jgi:hypothetical protein
MENAVLFGPFVGEMYWECGRFASMLPYYKTKKYLKQNPQFIILTRPDRFDLYGKNADILVPLNIDGDYEKFQPNCFRLDNYPEIEYAQLKKLFFDKYTTRYNILEHVVPDVSKARYANKNQFIKNNMIFKYEPRIENYELVNSFLPKNPKKIVLISPRYRSGFKRNWGHWVEFYDKLARDTKLNSMCTFIICGKKGEYIPDPKNRFLDMNEMKTTNNSSLVGLLLVLMEKASFVFGSQSAIPNIGLLYQVEVLTFGCQKSLHTKTYNIHNSKITFIDDKKYEIDTNTIFSKFKTLLMKQQKKGE